MEIVLNWDRIMGKDDFDSNREFLRKNGGIYIWIFKGKPWRVTYVGEADNFASRFVTHFSSILTGRRNTYDISEDDDFVRHLLKHYHEKTLDEIRANGKCYIPDQPHNPDFSFRETFFNEGLLGMHRKYFDTLAFAFAIDGGLQHSNIRKEVEGILIGGLMRLYGKGIKGGFIASRIEGSKDIPVGKRIKKPSRSYYLSHVGAIKDQIPPDIKRIVGYDKQPIISDS